ncbi:MAPK Phosphatase 4 [Carabus blaptoides fortunei]
MENASHTLRKESQLTRDDFDGGPVSLDCIESKIYLGNVTAAVDVETLQLLGITHILTLDSCPLPRKITDMPNLKTKFIHLVDLPKEDIISHLQETNAYINEAIANGVILVHCYFGMSRSGAVVIAYIMKKYKLSYEATLERVKEKRKIVHPNEGFVYQLKLYEEMGYAIDKSNTKYREFRLSMAADRVRKTKILPQCYMDLIKGDPGIMQVKPDPKVYRCKKCRRIVASESNVISHTERNKLYWNGKNRPDNKEETSDTEKDVCVQTYFVEPIAWMKNVTQTVQGKLHCPKCSSKLGSFSWIMGCQCPCGTKVSPAFYLIPSKVEWSNAVQNVQMTV